MMRVRNRVAAERRWRGLTLVGGRRPGGAAVSCCMMLDNHVFPERHPKSRTYREDDGDATAHSLAASQVGLLAQPQVLRLSAIALPACHGSSKQQHLYTVA